MKNQLKRTIGLGTAIAIVAGGVIGSGIFMKPASMAAQLNSGTTLLLVWIVAGFFTLLGAMGNAEVGAMMPHTGGQYIFFKEMYGSFIAYLYGWACFIVINTAGTVSIVFVAAEYMQHFFVLPRFDFATEHSILFHIPLIGTIYPLENIGVKSLTILFILLLTWISYKSTELGGFVQSFFTFIKISAILLLILGIFISGKGSFGNIIANNAEINWQGFVKYIAFFTTLSGAFMAYEGWNNLTFVAGEVINPQKNIPRSLIIGLTLCVLLYFFTNLAYLYVLPIEAMAKSQLVAADVANIVFGHIGSNIIAIMVMISALGAANSSVLSTARITQAMGSEGLFFKWAGQINSKNGTPGNALILHALWSILCALSGSFDMLADMFVFASWIFYALSAAGLFILRFKKPHENRPYKVWGYPILTGLFVLFATAYIVMTLYSDINNYLNGKTQLINSVMGLFLIAFGIPFYWYFNKMNIKK